VSGLALWPYALQVYGRPGVEGTLLELQDAHGQCVPYLLWALWLAAEGRAADDDDLTRAAELARAWQDAAVAPLRGLRRGLKSPSSKAPARAWSTLREGVKALELDAERMLLEMLEAASPASGDAPNDSLAMVRRAVGAWGRPAPDGLLDHLAAVAASAA